MTPFSALHDLIEIDGTTRRLTLPDDWRQGRTAYGGIVAALILQAVRDDNPDLPALRSAQVSFVGPAAGTLTITHKLLRAGKNNITIEGQLDGEAGIGTKVIFIFGHARETIREMDYPPRADMPSRDGGRQYIPSGMGPSFLEHFERLLITGSPPLSGDNNPDLTLWLRHRDEAAREGVVPLLALADAPPPASLSAVTQIKAISSVNWTLNFLRDNPRTADGWWLMRSATQHIRHGYSSQIMQIWNADGERVIDAMQHVAVFES